MKSELHVYQQFMLRKKKLEKKLIDNSSKINTTYKKQNQLFISGILIFHISSHSFGTRIYLATTSSRDFDNYHNITS